MSFPVSTNVDLAQDWSTHSNVAGLSPDQYQSQSNDPIRLARDHWVGRSAYINDSSAIIDAIDVEMLDVRHCFHFPFFAYL